jgi:phosphonate transport system substrate-binding protein
LLKKWNPIILFVMRHTLIQTLSLLVLAWTLAGCSLPGAANPGATPAATATLPPLGMAGNPIVLAIRPGSGPEAVEAVKRIAQQVASFSGLAVTAGQVETTHDLIESLGNGTVHVAVLPPIAYLAAHEKGYADAALAGTLNGKAKFGAQFLVNAQLAGVSGYKIYFDPQTNTNLVEPVAALAQFFDKKPCWSDAYSPVGYVFPIGIMKRAGIPLKSGAFLQGDDAVVKTLYQDKQGGLCEFGVTIIDSRADLAVAWPDVYEKVVVVWRSEEVIPIDGFAFASLLSNDARVRITAALLALSATPPGAQDLKTAYGLDGLQLDDDTFYAELRAYVGLANMDLNTLIR